MSRFLLVALTLFVCSSSFSQGTTGWKLDKMPVDLETDYALSSLPPHLRKDATVYLLDPMKGYYVGHAGSNGYIGRTINYQYRLAGERGFKPLGTRALQALRTRVAKRHAAGKPGNAGRDRVVQGERRDEGQFGEAIRCRWV